ncbi:hypothetical protein Q9S36_43015 [Microbacterium sp. ARD31]|uniref:hypothetical protein n=1 Tax=Microbacterium sp. ARD31 TaxID=2962576 RepID=UPI0028822ACE|nr:hypothetical protein [Microbacterium sp. ARD31]MDT0186976.1 hypothetical protein [Microbacterium sp. ARD31]
MTGPMGRRLLLVGLWAAVTAVAVLAGVFAISTVGATIRDRGPVGDEVARDTSVQSTDVPSPQGPAVRDEVAGEWGAFVVECRDTWAHGVAARPDRAAGWRVVSWEKGPDDDVDAVFSDGRNSVDLEVFCNRGRPTLAELERNTLGDD